MPQVSQRRAYGAAQGFGSGSDLALSRFGIAPQEEVRKLEKSWALYRKQNQLDLYGKQQQLTAGECAMFHDSGK